MRREGTSCGGKTGWYIRFRLAESEFLLAVFFWVERRARILDACAATLRLIGLIIASSDPQEEVLHYFPGDTLFAPHERRRGLPLGNQTSQFFANVYLNPIRPQSPPRRLCTLRG